MFRTIISWNIAASNRFDLMLPEKFRIDGNREFIKKTKESIPNGILIADIGGGKQPLFSSIEVVDKDIQVIGVDIDAEELQAAPPGTYFQKDCIDITAYESDIKADAVIVQSLLEHVDDGFAAIKGISTYCKQGAHVYTFCPNRYAWFAFINRILPQSLKLALLYTVFPSTKGHQGFPAYYSDCTPDKMIRNMESFGLRIVELRLYFISSYFKFCFPLFVLWRLINYPLVKLWPRIFCETFSIHAVKE